MSICHACGSQESRVINSRRFAPHNLVRRRRVCADCRQPYSTLELPIGEDKRVQEIIEWVVEEALCKDSTEAEPAGVSGDGLKSTANT